MALISIRWFWRALILAPAMLVVAGAAYGQAGKVALSVLPEASASSADPSAYHFRPEEADSSQGISHVFTLKNDTAKPVTIVRIDSSCSCTTAVAQSGSSGDAASGNITLQPGQQCHVKVTVGVGDAAQGDIDKMAWVHVADQAEPAATLHVIGTIDPPVMFAPTALDFGTVQYGKEQGRAVAIGVSRRLAAAGAASSPVSSIPFLKLQPSSSIIPGVNFPKTYRVQVYEVTLPGNAPMGPIVGSISLSQSAPAPSQPPAGAFVLGAGSIATTAAPAPSLPPASIPVRGNVAGDLSAAPSSAFFGTVSAGTPATAQVTVASASHRSMSGMTFTCDQPWLSARVVGPGIAPGSSVVEIKIGPSAPAGAQSGEAIGNIGGSRLAIPVMAFIVSEGK